MLINYKIKSPLIVMSFLFLICTGFSQTLFAKQSKAANEKQFSVSNYRGLAKTISCTEVGNSIAKAYTLKKKGKSKEDIYWEITPEDSSYIKQDIYTILIDVGMDSDDATYKKFTEACRQNMNTYQGLFDGQSELLYGRVDLIYLSVYNEELANHNRGYTASVAYANRYGWTKKKATQLFINDKSEGGLDGISNEINNLIAEEVFSIIYDEKLMGKAGHPGNVMPPLNSVKAKLASELVLKLVK